MDVFGISNISTLVDKIGTWQTILVIVVLGMVYVLSKHLIKRIDNNFNDLKLSNEKLKQEIADSKKAIEEELKKKHDQKINFMKNHPFFATMDYLVEVKIPGIHFKSQFKRIVFTDILVYKIRAAQDVFRDFVISESNYDTGSLEFRNYVTKAMKNSYQKFIADCENSMISEVVLDSYTTWFSPLSRFMFSQTENICDSKMYETNVDKINAILSINLAIFDEMVSNIEVYLDEINGDFVGITYKGVLCEEEHH